MAGRFSNLELGRIHPEPEPNTDTVLRGEPIRSAHDFLRQADAAHHSGRFEPALKLFTRALGEDRALVSAWVGQVQMLVELGEYPEGRLWADKALELFRGNGELLAARAQACLRLGDHRAAQVSCDAATAAPGTSAFRWRARGEVLLGQNSARAQDLFRKSLAEPAAEWFDRTAIAGICLFHSMPAAGVEYAKDGVKLGSGQAYGWLVLGRCQESLGWADQAAASYARALQLDHSLPGARTALAAAQSRGVLSRMSSRIKGLFSK